MKSVKSISKQGYIQPNLVGGEGKKRRGQGEGEREVERGGGDEASFDSS